MKTTQLLKEEMITAPQGVYADYYYKYTGFREKLNFPVIQSRAKAVENLFSLPEPFVYKNDWIAGSVRPMWCEKSEEELKYARTICNSYGERTFAHNSDHYSPNYKTIVNIGVSGLFEQIKRSQEKYAHDEKKLEYLSAMKQTLEGFQKMLLNYAKKAEELKTHEGYSAQKLDFISNNCKQIANSKPETFAQALQLVWACHIAFKCEGRFAMALGRMDNYLYPFYKKDIQSGLITKEFAIELLENVFIKIYEWRAYLGGDDTVNICIGGTSLNGESDVNELSYCILEAVKNCNVPGPNLSARVPENVTDEFLDECLKVIGTGLGYPALMNDRINIAALEKIGYSKEDVYDYTMVGCIENFVTGKQPPWSDGRFDTPRFFEYIFNDGKGIVHPSIGLNTGSVEEIQTMQQFISVFEKQLAYGANEYYAFFNNENSRYSSSHYQQPFLSLFCEDCIGRALDINEGGSKYPSVHGVALMGVGTVCDSLAAIEKVIFEDKFATLAQLGQAIKNNFEGYDELREMLLNAPKYGNNDDYVDKYAVWFVDYLASLFSKFKTRDGGDIYIAMAANTSNIYAGKILAATPDGRLAYEPLSDAASPTYGKDVHGATYTVNSVTKPDYTKVACGTVVNQKFSPSMFEGAKRKKLLALIKTYFKKGGQEMQINATSREILMDAMNNPKKYTNLVVRVSGFSAFYVTLDKDVQIDILNRTQQE